MQLFHIWFVAKWQSKLFFSEFSHDVSTPKVCQLDFLQPDSPDFTESSGLHSQHISSCVTVNATQSVFLCFRTTVFSCVYAHNHGDCLLCSEHFQNTGNLHIVLHLNASYVETHTEPQLLLLLSQHQHNEIIKIWRCQSYEKVIVAKIQYSALTNMS